MFTRERITTTPQLIPGLCGRNDLKILGVNLINIDLGSVSIESKKDAKLGFVVNYTNLLLIPGLICYGLEASRVQVGPGIRKETGGRTRSGDRLLFPDLWSIVKNVTDHLRNGPGISLE